MPNPHNVAAPINIHGIGRSGTTLLQNILGSSGFIQVCNETNGFVFSCYRGGEVLNASHDKQAPGGAAATATRSLHAALCAAMPSDKPSWCQKLGGIPNCMVWDGLIEEADRSYAPETYPFPYAWFWRALRHAFAHSTDILILRDWRDVVVSRSRFSGYRAEAVVDDLAVYYNIMAHPASRIDHSVRYESLVATPDATVAELFDRIGLVYSEQRLQAMEWYAAPSPDRRLEEARAAGFSWRAQHDALRGPGVARVIVPALARLGARLAIDPATLGALPGSEQPVQEPAQATALGIGAVAAAV